LFIIKIHYLTTEVLYIVNCNTWFFSYLEWGGFVQVGYEDKKIDLDSQVMKGLVLEYYVENLSATHSHGYIVLFWMTIARQFLKSNTQKIFLLIFAYTLYNL